MYTVVVYHLVDYNNFPLAPSYRFPTLSITTAYILSLPIVLWIEWYYQREFRDPYPSIEKLRKLIPKMLMMIVVALALAFAVISFKEWGIYQVTISLILSVGSLMFWLLLIYGKDVLKGTTVNVPNEEMTIKSGKTTHKIKFDELAYFSSMNKIVIAQLISGKRIITGYNLSELENKLPRQFFRINRQYILNKSAVADATRTKNQKVSIALKEEISPEPLLVSRYRISAFYDWINS